MADIDTVVCASERKCGMIKAVAYDCADESQRGILLRSVSPKDGVNSQSCKHSDLYEVAIFDEQGFPHSRPFVLGSPVRQALCRAAQARLLWIGRAAVTVIGHHGNPGEIGA